MSELFRFRFLPFPLPAFSVAEGKIGRLLWGLDKSRVCGLFVAHAILESPDCKGEKTQSTQKIIRFDLKFQDPLLDLKKKTYSPWN